MVMNRVIHLHISQNKPSIREKYMTNRLIGKWGFILAGVLRKNKNRGTDCNYQDFRLYEGVS